MNLKLRQYRERFEMTQQELAKAIGKSFRTVQAWEREESYPNAEMVWKLCEVFDTDPNDLLGWYEEHPRAEAPDLTDAENEIVSCYRTAAPQWRTNIAMTARAAAGESLKAAKNPVPSDLCVSEAM
ncbi:MAG: helix-turn-helix transcriptional regulator [Raoultibacter sp.]